MSGYHNGDRTDGPPRNVLSDDTVRRAMARANSSQSERPSGSSPSRPDSTRRTSTQGRPTKQRDCDCLDCRDLSKRDTYGTERIDKRTGDRIREHSGDGDLPLHLHGVRDDEQPDYRRSPPNRSSTGRSLHSKSGSPPPSNKNISVTRDREGNRVEEWNGAEGPSVRTHYDWDAPENKIDFPDAPAGYGKRRTNTSGSSRRG